MRFRHVIRRLVQMPVFTSVAVLTLALGIGANTAIFSVVEAVLLRPLPYPSPDELLNVDHAAPGVGVKNAGAAPFLYFTYRDEARTFHDLGLWSGDTLTVTGRAEPEQVDGLDVTERVLPALGVQPFLGRLFTQKDDSPGSPETILLTFGYWRAKFGGDASAVGQRLVLDGRPREIIGILPASFRFLDRTPSVILPLRFNRAQTYLGNFSYSAIARLNRGSTMTDAEADVARMIPISLERFPAFPGFSAKLFSEARLGPSLRSLKQSLIGDLGTILWVLMGTIGIVLVIACANVANLLLVRVEARQQELAIRAALGAGWGHIARELLMESVTLGLLGAIAGLGLASGALRLIKNIAPSNLPRIDQVAIDGPVLLFTIATALVAGLLFGSIPVVKYVGPHVADALRSGGRTASQSRERHHASNTLVVVQVALALVLLVSSGLMIRTFQALKHVRPGFTRPEEVQTLRISIPQSLVGDPIHVARMEQTIADKIGAIPGIQSVGLSSTIPMAGSGRHDPIFTEDHSESQQRFSAIRLYKFVSPGLIRTMGNSLIAGRDFTWTDVYDKNRVAMVSENLARELWGEPSAAIGKRIRDNLKAPWREIVGVVSDEREDGVNQPAPAIAYWPILMDQWSGEDISVRRTLAYVIRTSRAGSAALLSEISQAVWSVNSNLPLANVRTLQEIYQRSLARTSFTLIMLAIAAGMALLLGIAGISGVISYAVSQRTREIGIRMALGARHADVTRMFVEHGVRLAGVGVLCGLGAAMASMRLMSSLLFNVTSVDPLTYSAVVLALGAAAILASYIPAWRAASVDPVHALRTE